MASKIRDVRITPDSGTISRDLGLLADLAGTWQGHGFNLIARPDFEGQEPLYLQLNQTDETLQIEPIGSPVPDRGFGQDDIELFGLTYLDRISDTFTNGALHIEPGIWVTQPATTYPPEAPPAEGQIIERLATIPHGTSLLAQGNATPFSGPPTLTSGSEQYAFSAFPSFNSTPFPIPNPSLPTGFKINAAGSSEQKSAPGGGGGFPPYTLTNPDSATVPRTPFDTNPPDPPLPADIDGVAMQDVVNDPILLLQAVVKSQVAEGYTFEGAALNITTEPTITFLTMVDDPTGPSRPVTVTDGAGGLANSLFLEGASQQDVVGAVGPNALTSLVYATFWIEKVSHPDRDPFMQLQYAQMTVLNFNILNVSPPALLGWPHVSVSTLRKSFL
jgi:hypothetical protein